MQHFESSVWHWGWSAPPAATTPPLQVTSAGATMGARTGLPEPERCHLWWYHHGREEEPSVRGLGEQSLRKMFLVCYFTDKTNKSQILMAVETGGKDSVLLHVQHPSGKKVVEGTVER